MLPAGDQVTIANLCKAIGNELTDDSGFVPVRNLLTRFHAELFIRPLLVEGMLASVATNSGGDRSSRWAVLIDSDTYPLSNHDVDEEKSSRPLPHRMRNTIAHELVHSLAFRPSEFGIRLKARTDTKKSLSEFVNALEKETEQLSPLLLWSEKALGMLLRGKKESLSLSDLLHVMETVGISRYVLINRLNLLEPTDSNGFRFKVGLQNFAVGLGVWGPKRSAQIKAWPMFWNFDAGSVPSFLLKTLGHESVPAETVFDDMMFAMCDGPNSVVELETGAGTRTVPNARKMKVQITVEDGERNPGRDFLFVVRGI